MASTSPSFGALVLHPDVSTTFTSPGFVEATQTTGIIALDPVAGVLQNNGGWPDDPGPVAPPGIMREPSPWPPDKSCGTGGPEWSSWEVTAG